VHKDEKEQVVAELTERLRTSETLIVADYRGLTNKQIEDLRTKLLDAGARFAVVKNTLTRRAAEAAGTEALLALLEGPTAIAFLETGGDPVAVAKALGDAARDTKVLALRGGVMQGSTISADQLEELAKLPPVDVLRGQVLGAITAPLTQVIGLFVAPIRDLVGLIDARIAQLEEGGDTSAAAAEAPAPADAPEAPAAEAPAAEATGTDAEAEAQPEDEEAGDAPVAAAATDDTPEEDAPADASDTAPEQEEQD
jgi:large subunit ribosomal protein L10